MAVLCSLPYPDGAIPKGGAFGDTAPPRTRPHRGVDWSLYHVRRLGLDPWWTFVTDGVITLLSATDKGELGFIVEVRDAEGWYWTYAHSAEFVDGLRVGARVARRQRGGRMGSTGTVVQPGSEHLHLALSRTSGGGISGTVVDPLAHIKARLTSTAGSGTTPLPNRRRKSMSTLFYTDGGQFALAGESPGTTANWLETKDQALANALAAVHGNAVWLSRPSYDTWKARYLEPVKTPPVTVGEIKVQSDPELVPAVKALPGEIATAYFVEAKKAGN